jgi:hypothetical protein
MKKAVIAFICLVFIASCKNDKKPVETVDVKELTTAQKIAVQAGIDNWSDIEEIKFTFNVGRIGRNVVERKWTWNPNTDDVQIIALGDTIAYNRNNKLDSIQTSVDRGFVNDTYWLMPEFKLIWDEGTKITEATDQISPIKKDTLDRITILYTGNGGYTPGDAYDLYYDSEFKIKEWAYRSKNDTAVTLATTFEEHKTFKDFTFATDHRSPDRMTRINFTDIEITKKK